MNKYIVLLVFIVSTYLNYCESQISYTDACNSNTGWTQSGFGTNSSGYTSCTGAVFYDNLWSSQPISYFYRSFTGSNGQQITFTWDFEAEDYSSSTTTSTSSYNVALEYSTNGSTWSLVGNMTESASTTCETKTMYHTPASGTIYYRWYCTRSAGDFDMTFDNISLQQASGPSISYSSSSYSTSQSDPSPTLTNNAGAGTYSSTAGLVFADVASNTGSSTGVIDLSASSAGTYTITYTDTDAQTATFDVTITTPTLYYVNDNSLTGDIYCSAIGNDAYNGTDPSTPKATLKDILNDYDLDPGDIVYVDAGTYSDLDVDNSNDNGFFVQGAGNTLTIYDAVNAGKFWYSFDSHGTVTFEDIKFYRYYNSSGDGGCFYQANDGTALTLIDCIIDDCNVAGLGSGSGAIRYYSANTLTLTNCTISNCDTPAGSTSEGGAIQVNKSGASLVMTNCTLHSNTAGNGGAIDVTSIGSGTVTITSCTFYNNTAEDGTSYAQGGAIQTGGTITGDIRISKSIFYGNTANEQGGACYFDTDGTIYLENCLFYENASDEGVTYGQGGAVMFECAGTHYITNCTFADNTATDEGGALFLYSTGALIIEAKNSLFYNNVSTAFTADDIEAGSETVNLTNCSYTSAADIDLNGGTNTLPQIGDPSFTNSASDDYTISGSSICIDNGTSTGAPADDLAGNTRDGSPDIGAYELAMNIWDGSSSSDWKTAANWSDNVVPTTESVLIPTSGSYTNPPIIDEADAVCGSITLQGDAVLTLSSGKLTATGSVSMASTSEIQFDGGELECSGKFSADGILDINSGTLDVDGEFEIGSTLTEEITGGTIEVAGDFDGASEGDGDFTPSGGTVILNGSSGTTVDNHSSATFYNLTLDQAGVKSSSGSITVSNDFTINSGSQLTQSANRLTIAGSLDISGTLNHSGGDDIYLTGSSKTLSGTGTQTTANYMLDVGADYNLTDNWSINTFETWTGGATLSVATTKTLTIASTFYTRTNAAITLTGSANMTIGGDAWMAAEAGAVFTLNSGTLDLNGTNAYICGASGTFNANSGTIRTSSTTTTISGTFNEGTSTFEYDGGTQSVAGDTYYNLTISSAGTKTAAGNIDVNGDFITAATATCALDLTTYDLNVAGDLTVGATDGLDLSDASALLTLDGTTDQTVSHAGNSSGSGTTTLLTETFDNAWSSLEKPTASWTSDVASNSGQAWHRNDVTTNWSYTSSGSPSSNGYSGGGTDYYARFHSYGITSPNTTYIQTPSVDMSSYSPGALTFYYINTSGTDVLEVYFYNGTSWVKQGSSYTTQASWGQKTIAISGAYLNPSFAVRFKATSDYGTTDIGLDQVVISGDYSYSGTESTDLTINKASGSVLLSSTFRVDGTLTFTSGDIDATTNNLVFTANGTTTGASDASHVNGTIVKTTESTSAFTFPIGDGTTYRPIGITPDGASSTDWTVSYTASSHPDTDVDGSGLDHISTQEYWDLDRSGSANASISLTWSAANGITDYTELTIAHYDGTTDWDMIASTPSGSNTSGTINSDAAVTTFSPFTIGSTGSANPLPVNLVAFYGENKNQTNNLKWVTASEKNSDYFTIEKTTDGILFEPVGTRQGAGNSIYHTSYLLVDDNVEPVINYYRLKQTDFDGNSKYSDLISIDNRLENQKDKTLIRITNTWGQEVKDDFRGVVIYIYSDGSIERVFQN